MCVKTIPEEEKIDFSEQGAIGKYLVDKIEKPLSSAMTDEEKEKIQLSIDKKLQSGKKLSKKEEQYLRETNPKLYMEYMRIRQRAKALLTQLKHAKSKQEVDRIMATAMASVSKKDPMKAYIVAALQAVEKDFKKSKAYQELPNTSAEKKKHTSKCSDYEEKEDSDSEEDEFDPMKWSPLQEIIDSMPKFDMPA